MNKTCAQCKGTLQGTEELIFVLRKYFCSEACFQKYYKKQEVKSEI
jgi:hypothetical protein